MINPKTPLDKFLSKLRKSAFYPAGSGMPQHSIVHVTHPRQVQVREGGGFACPLASRLSVGEFDKLVTSSSLWCCSAIVPNRMALLLVNRHLLRLVVWMLRSKRASRETWLEHHLQELRTARAVVHSTIIRERWSTRWLRRMWGYMGHVARGTHKESPPASSVLSNYRDRNCWYQQQQQSTHIRHKGRVFPKLANWERDLMQGGLESQSS